MLAPNDLDAERALLRSIIGVVYLTYIAPLNPLTDLFYFYLDFNGNLRSSPIDSNRVSYPSFTCTCSTLEHRLLRLNL